METSISLNRDSGYADRVRDYVVLLDSTEIGRIANGETKTFAVLPGEYELRLKIDWCGSNAMKVQLDAGQQLKFRCGSSLRGYELLFSLYYATIARTNTCGSKQTKPNTRVESALRAPDSQKRCAFARGSRGTLDEGNRRPCSRI